MFYGDLNKGRPERSNVREGIEGEEGRDAMRCLEEVEAVSPPQRNEMKQRKGTSLPRAWIKGKRPSSASEKARSGGTRPATLDRMTLSGWSLETRAWTSGWR